MALVGHEARPKGLNLFDDEESDLVARALVALANVANSDAELLSARMAQLAEINKLVWAAPSLRTPETLGGDTRYEETLILHLCDIDGLSGDCALPLKSTLQRTFLTAKIQFLRGLVKATWAWRAQATELKALNLDLREELAQSMYTLMAEELLLALLRKPDIAKLTKRHAAQQLIAIWDNATLEIDDFCPLLESAWHARNRVAVGLGSLLGATEYFRLVAEDCAPQFLDFFSRDEVSVAENQAFSEFLFGLTYEEMDTLRAAMRDQGIDAAHESWASQVLGRPLEHDCSTSNTNEIDPVALYRSYSRRQLAADFRILGGGDGPGRTAEAYLMVYLLDLQQD